MSDTMLLGVLRMPLNYVGAPLSPIAQLVTRAREAADRIEADAAAIAAKDAEIAALRADAERYRWLCDKLGETQLPTLIERITMDYVADYKPSIDAAIDAAREAG